MTEFGKENFEWPPHLGPDDSTICLTRTGPEVIDFGKKDRMASSLACQRDERLDTDLKNCTELPPRPANLNIRRKSPKSTPKKHQKNNGSTTLKRKPRVENKLPPISQKKLDEKELMRQETKLVVLEYLSNLPDERIHSRKKRESNPVLKAKTIHSSERPFLDVVERSKKSASLKRRNSEQYDQKVREQLKNMAYPLRMKLSPAVLADITRFDKKSLNEVSNMRNERGHRLSLLRFSAEDTEGLPQTPITSVTTRLEEMSKDIMKDYPQLLDEHLTELLTPLDSGEKLTYEDFAAVAKSVFEKQLSRFTGSAWNKIAMVFYLVKEVVFSGGLSEIQVEILVEYATRFIAEHSLEPIRKEGGWAALELQDDELFSSQDLRGDIYGPLGDENDIDFVDGHQLEIISRSRENSTEDDAYTFSYTEAVKDVVKTWTTYGVAAVGVGIAVAYSYMKQQ